MSEFLNVSSSLTGRKWVGPALEVQRNADLIRQTSRFSHPLCQVLSRRGVQAHEAQSFLEPKLKELLPDPRHLKDMEKAAKRFVAAAQKKERIAVFADYDVDGATSGAQIILWLREFGLEATLYIPDRIDEGYGPNNEAMAELARHHDLIVCVDCGTLSHEPISAAKGADVIVLDHHLGGETLPECVAVVNPNRQDETGELAHLCAAAVVFLMLVEAGRQLREMGQAGPNLMSYLDLVALGTVADVAPLIGVNRALVRQGLKIMARRERIGLRALADVARMENAPNSYALGFLLGPRINAGGRIGAADLGARLLVATDEHEARELALRLDELNTERRDIEATVRLKACEQIETRDTKAALIWAADEGWHPGVVGIVASRLKEMYNRPAVVIGFENGLGKGSGRSITGVDLGAAIQRLASEGLLIKGGGHKMAAGLSVAQDQLEGAMARLSELLAKQGADQFGPADLKLDGMLMPQAATIELIEQLEAAGPYGASAANPRFAIPSCQIHFAKRIGEKHLKLSFSDGTGPRLEAICFGAYENEIGPALEAHAGARFHLAGRLEINSWAGRNSVQLRLEDAAPA